MIAKNRIFLTLFMSLALNTATAYASSIYDCTAALTNLDRLAKAPKQQFYDTDLKKQLADIVIIKAPILLTPTYQNNLQQLFVAANLVNYDNDYIKNSFKTSKYIEGRHAPLLDTNYKDICFENIRNLEEKLWGQILLSYRADVTPSADAKTLEEESRHALNLGLTHEQFIAAQKILRLINGDPTLLLHMRNLIHESILYSRKYNFDKVDFKARKAFIDELPGRLIDFAAEEDVRSHLLEVVPNNITIDSFNGENITFTEHRESEQEQQTHPLPLLVTKEYPILWGKTFNKALSQAINTMGSTPQAFIKEIKSLSGSDRMALAKTIWGYTQGFYNVPQGATLDSMRKGISLSSETKLAATELDQSVENYFRTRLMIYTLTENAEVQKTLLNHIAATLEDGTKLLILSQKNKVQTFLFSGRYEKEKGALLGKILKNAHPTQEEHEE